MSFVGSNASTLVVLAILNRAYMLVDFSTGFEKSKVESSEVSTQRTNSQPSLVGVAGALP